MKRAKRVHTTWKPISICVATRSCVGPKMTRSRLITVRLFVITRPSDICCQLIRRNERSTITIRRPNLLSSSNRNSVVLMCNRSVFASYLGKRCRGQGTKWKSCGVEQRKFKICGTKKSKSVLLKCPKMPTTAKVIPAKQQQVSPTKTCDGYLEAKINVQYINKIVIN